MGKYAYLDFFFIIKGHKKKFKPKIGLLQKIKTKTTKTKLRRKKSFKSILTKVVRKKKELIWLRHRKQDDTSIPNPSIENDDNLNSHRDNHKA